jgi:flagellar motor switch protein FliG
MAQITIEKAQLEALLELNAKLEKDLVTVLENAYQGFQPINQLANILNGSPGQMITQIGKIFSDAKSISETVKPNIDVIIAIMKIYTPQLLDDGKTEKP